LILVLVDLGFHIGPFNSQNSRGRLWIGLLEILGYDNKLNSDFYKGPKLLLIIN
jgi:hypothetical protein